MLWWFAHFDKKPALFVKVCLNPFFEDNQKNPFFTLDNYKSSIKIGYRKNEASVIDFMGAYADQIFFALNDLSTEGNGHIPIKSGIIEFRKASVKTDREIKRVLVFPLIFLRNFAYKFNQK